MLSSPKLQSEAWTFKELQTNTLWKLSFMSKTGSQRKRRWSVKSRRLGINSIPWVFRWQSQVDLKSAWRFPSGRAQCPKLPELGFSELRVSTFLNLSFSWQTLNSCLPVSSLSSCFLGSLESSFGLPGQKLTCSLAEKDREGMCARTHTRTPLSHGEGKSSPHVPKGASGCHLIPLHLESRGVDTERRRESNTEVDFSHLTPPHPHLARTYYHHLLLQWMQLNTPPCLICWEPEMLLTNYYLPWPLAGLCKPHCTLTTREEWWKKLSLEGRWTWGLCPTSWWSHTS